MAQNIEAARARAEAVFKRSDEHLSAGPVATQRDADTLALQEKTARLRALRIAKEEIERQGRTRTR